MLESIGDPAGGLGGLTIEEVQDALTTQAIQC